MKHTTLALTLIIIAFIAVLILVPSKPSLTTSAAINTGSLEVR